MDKELKEIHLLQGKGEDIGIGTIQMMSLRRIIAISELAIEMKIDTQKLTSDDENEIANAQFLTVATNAERCAKIVAIAITEDFKNEALLKKQTDRVLDNLNSEELKNAFIKILKTADFSNFIISTFLMNGNQRPTQALKVEEFNQSMD